MAMPLSAMNIAYQVVLDSFVNFDLVTSSMEEEDHVLKPVRATSLSCSHECLDDTFPLDEAIIEAINGTSKKTWDDMHHRFYFLPELERIEKYEFRSTLSEIVSHVIVPIDTHKIYAKGNMVSISPIVTIDISRPPGKIENVHIGADCLPEEILIYTKLFNEFRDVFACYMKRFQVSTLVFSRMILELNQMLNLFENVLELSIPGRPLLLRQR
jgi:hypothetical protein